MPSASSARPGGRAQTRASASQTTDQIWFRLQCLVGQAGSLRRTGDPPVACSAALMWSTPWAWLASDNGDSGAQTNYPPPTNCTISNDAPAATGVADHSLFGTIARFNSTATRSPSIPSAVSSEATFKPAATVRDSPFTTISIRSVCSPVFDTLFPPSL